MDGKILIVDDEINVLDGLKRILRPMSPEWHIEYTDSGSKALEILGNDRFDILVTDMQMPGMDGIELLEEVQKKHPEIIRIVLSGYTEFVTAMKVMGLVHQFITKPCQPDNLKETLSRALLLKKILGNEQLVKLITEMKSLPSLPDVYLKLRELLRSPDIRIDKVSDIIASDIGMTAKILQLVNSSFFGISCHIKDPGHAVRMLGLDIIKLLVLSSHIFSMFDTEALKDFPISHMKNHSMNVAAYAKKIAQIETRDNKIAEDAFISGMLHDCGKIILIERLPEKYLQVLDCVQNRKLSTCEAEINVFGATHSDVGAYLLGLWGMPNSMIEAIVFHHNPIRSQSNSFNTLTCVHVADYLSNEMSSDNNSAVKLDLEYLNRLNVADHIDIWRDICQATVMEGVQL